MHRDQTETACLRPSDLRHEVRPAQLRRPDQRIETGGAGNVDAPRLLAHSQQAFARTFRRDAMHMGQLGDRMADSVVECALRHFASVQVDEGHVERHGRRGHRNHVKPVSDNKNRIRGCLRNAQTCGFRNSRHRQRRFRPGAAPEVGAASMHRGIVEPYRRHQVFLHAVHAGQENMQLASPAGNDRTPDRLKDANVRSTRRNAQYSHHNRKLTNSSARPRATGSRGRDWKHPTDRRTERRPPSDPRLSAVEQMHQRLHHYLCLKRLWPNQTHTCAHGAVHQLQSTTHVDCAKATEAVLSVV